jgi:Tfp pilus assembly protein PilN
MYIEINLLPGAKKKKKARGAGLALPDFGQLLAKVRDPLLVGAIAAWVVALSAVGYVFFNERAALAELKEQHRRGQQQERQYAALIRQKKIAAMLRDSLVAELTAIREIDADRFVWPHILDEVTRALPERTWLVSLEFLTPPQPVAVGEEADTLAPPPLRFQISGRTAAVEWYTRFLRQLQDSPWIEKIDWGPANLIEEDEKTLYAFSITATFQQARADFVQTVPLSESVR